MCERDAVEAESRTNEGKECCLARVLSLVGISEQTESLYLIRNWNSFLRRFNTLTRLGYRNKKAEINDVLKTIRDYLQCTYSRE